MSDQYTPTGGQTIFPRINYLKTFSSRFEQRSDNGRIFLSSGAGGGGGEPTGEATLDLRLATSLSLADAVSGNNLVTFTRASTGTYVDSNGVIQTAAIDAPRFDHDPVTGESLGLLVEESRTNLQLYSNSPDNAWWNQTTKASDIVPNSITAPDNTVTAAFFPTGGAFGKNRITSSFSYYALSCFVKTGTATSIELSTSIDGAAASCYATYAFSTNSIVTGMIGGNSPTRYRNLSATSVNYPNGWIRLCFVFEFYANASPGINTQYNLTGGSGYIWGAQLEANASFPTSYIPTTTSAVTRAADVASIEGTNFSSWYNQSEGSVFVELGSDQGGVSGRFELSDDSNVNRIQSRNNQLYCFNGTQQFNLTYTSSLKEASAFSGTSTSVAVSGSVVATHGATSLPTCTHIELGRCSGTLDYLNGHISRLSYFPVRKSDEDLITLTT